MDAKNIIKRDIYQELKAHASKKEISLLVGPHQAGKTTIMRFLEDELKSEGKKTLFLSLDSEQDSRFFKSQKAFVDKIKLEFGNDPGFVFIDEIQRKADAGIFLKGIYDMDFPYKLIVSGSGSVELKEKVHESLAGRKLIFEILPISFKEFVSYKTEYKYRDRLDKFFKLEQERLVGFMEEYLLFGSYPRIITAPSREEKLRNIDEIFRSYVEKDISFLLRVEKLDAFNELVQILASQTGQILNYAELSRTLGISLATVRNYLWYLEKTYIIELVTPFFRNKRKEITKSPAVYFYDLGLRNYASGNYGREFAIAEKGFIFQNFVFMVLREKLKFTGEHVHFWRTKDKAEVDFVIAGGQRILPVEVKYTSGTHKTLGRSLIQFIERYNPEKAIIVTREFSAEEKVKNTTVRFIPFFDLYEAF